MIKKALIFATLFRFFSCRGAEPKQLAFSAALGITMGVFPICGAFPHIKAFCFCVVRVAL